MKKEPTYVWRDVLNTEDILTWAKAQGFTAAVPANELHVTLAYSSTPFDFSEAGEGLENVLLEGGERSVEPLGDEGAVVLKFSSEYLQIRWQDCRDAGASWDYDSYTPHITITYKMAEGFDISKVEPYMGMIELGPEQSEPLNLDWKDGIVEENKVLQDLIKIQGTDGTWNYDPYMHGLLNGLICADAVVDSKEPEYKEAPPEWLVDKETDDAVAVAEANLSNKSGALGLTSYNQEINYFGTVVKIKPSTFLKLALPLEHRTSVDFFKTVVQNNKPMANPMLYIKVPSGWKSGDFSGDTPFVTGHEGRNRMTAILEEEGDEPVPVHILLRSDEVEWRNRDITPEILAKLNDGVRSETKDFSLAKFFTESGSTFYYEPENEAVFNSAVEKIAKKLFKPFKEVAYHYTLNPKYYDEELVNPDGFADEEFALGISDSQTYADQKQHIQKVYGLSDDEVNEVVSSEAWWHKDEQNNVELPDF
jgi:hypothetical protein